MTAGLLPVPKARFFDNAGAPLSGGLLYSYIAGTTTPLATYTSFSGLVANSNPIVLDSAGYADVWLVGNYKFILKDSSGVQIWSEDNILAAGTGGNYFADTGGANAYIINPVPSSTGYVAGQIYDVAISAANTGASTLNVNGLGVKNITYADGSALTIGALPTGSVVRLIYDGAEFQLQNIKPIPGAISFTSITLSSYLNEAKAPDIASAPTVAIGAAAGNFMHVTGTTTITAFDTIQAGTRRILEFDGILTLTYNATSLILPGSANITTAAGDCATFISEGAGNWRCVNYSKSSGKAIISNIVQPAITGFLPTLQTFTSNVIASMTISGGNANDSTFAQILSTAGTLSWNITNGNAANGYQGGTTLPNSSTIHFYVMINPALGAIATFASLSLTPTLPTGYVGGYYRRMFSIPTTSAGVLRNSNSVFEGEGGSYFYWYNTSPLDVSVVNLGTSFVQYPLSVPTGFRVALFYRVNTPTSAASVALFSGDEGAAAVPAQATGGFTTAPGFDLQFNNGTSNIAPQKSEGLTTDTNAQIGAISSTASTSFYFVTRGYKDFRR